MATEIERKFLVDTALWRPKDAGTLYRQGYLSTAPERTVRVRVAGDLAFLTIKGRTEGISRAEFEYAIPPGDANAMLNAMCEGIVMAKTRHKETHGGKVWEIDVFQGENEGLVIAEVELERADEDVALPSFVKQEVSGDPRYYNSNLALKPFRTW